MRHADRVSNYPYSEVTKVPSVRLLKDIAMNIGDLMYLICERDKHQPRPRYIVASRDGQWLNLKKFTNSQLRIATYRVKQSECYKSPQDHVLDDSLLPSATYPDTEEDQTVAPPPPVRELEPPHNMLPLPGEYMPPSPPGGGRVDPRSHINTPSQEPIGITPINEPPDDQHNPSGSHLQPATMSHRPVRSQSSPAWLKD